MLYRLTPFVFFFLIYFWLCWVFVAARRLSLVVASRGRSSFRCVGFSLQWLLWLWSMGSRPTGFSICGSRALECRLSSCGARASLLRGMWDISGPGLERVSPALAGRVLTTAPPGKPPFVFYTKQIILQRMLILGFPGGAVVENLPANAGDTGSSPGLGRSHMPRSSWARDPQLLSLRVWSLCPATGGAAIVKGPRTAMKSGPHLS